ncbi:hypothetical protein [Kocuria turfanensis]|uniref:Uncharacterized protein n=1 Tax=Kocuria turfanensis TaxID=388357 RepID=A0A512IGI3_9MICC|nr:hypothetical protein [Kocuria turfanensis]GEO96816.1 hypothetical protein KTU01_29390 [Kocuria turfanensis]
MTAEGGEQRDTSAAPDGTSRTRPPYWVLQVLVRAVPVVVVLQVSFEVLLRNNWFVADSPYTPGLVAGLLAFVPAGVWAVVDGYRYVPTPQVVALWAAAGAMVALVNTLYGYLSGLWVYVLDLPLRDLALMLAELLPLAVMYAGPAALLALLGAGLYRVRESRTSS